MFIPSQILYYLIILKTLVFVPSTCMVLVRVNPQEMLDKYVKNEWKKNMNPVCFLRAMLSLLEWDRMNVYQFYT
jgi:hypothetical protein